MRRTTSDSARGTSGRTLERGGSCASPLTMLVTLPRNGLRPVSAMKMPNATSEAMIASWTMMRMLLGVC